MNVINTWDNNKVVFTGTFLECEKYIRGNNVYQMNYSKLKLSNGFDISEIEFNSLKKACKEAVLIKQGKLKPIPVSELWY